MPAETLLLIPMTKKQRILDDLHTVRERLIKETPAKEGELTSDPRLKKIFAA